MDLMDHHAFGKYTLIIYCNSMDYHLLNYEKRYTNHRLYKPTIEVLKRRIPLYGQTLWLHLTLREYVTSVSKTNGGFLGLGFGNTATPRKWTVCLPTGNGARRIQ